MNGRLTTGAHRQSAAYRADTLRDSFSVDAALPYCGFAQTLFDIAAFVLLSLFLSIGAVSLPLAIVAMLFLEF